MFPLRWWVMDRAPSESELRRADLENEEVLRTVHLLDDFSLDGGEESVVPASDAMRLELKLNLLIDWVGELIRRTTDLPEPVPATLSASELTWEAEWVPQEGSWIGAELYPAQGCPKPLMLIGRQSAAAAEDGRDRIRMTLEGLGETSRDLLEKWIFRFHRRAVAAARGTGRT